MKLIVASTAFVFFSIFIKVTYFDTLRFSDIFTFYQIILIIFCLFFLSFSFSLVDIKSKKFKNSPGFYGVFFLINWLLIIIQGGSLIGLLINFYPIYNTAKAQLAFKGAQFEYVSPATARLRGMIGTKTLNSLIKLNNENNLKQIFLDSHGGLIFDSIQIGDFVNKNNITVIVEEFCSSSCVLVAAKSKTLIASRQARFGFHQGSALYKDNSQYSNFISISATEQLLAELKKLKIPENVLVKMKKTPNSELVIFTGSELFSFGVVDILN